MSVKDGLSQEVTVNTSVYNTLEVLKACIANEIAMNCYKTHSSFATRGTYGQLKIDILQLVSKLKKDFGLREYSRDIANCIYEDAFVTSFRLVTDDAFVWLDADRRASYGDEVMEPEEVSCTSSKNRDEDKNNVWNLLFGGSLETCEKFTNFFKEYFSKINPEKKGIYSMVEGRGRLDLYHIGYPGKEIIKENYSSEVVKGFERIVEDISSENPLGCLSIISGPPGTGKTYMVRAIIDATEQDALFIIIPPQVIASMSGPHMVPLLVDIKECYLVDKTCVVFVVEDADDILVPRGSDNIAAISTLLNISDGILGSMFKMRIIATTNANALEFDPALTRPGRLSCRLDIGMLSKEEAIIAYDAITKTKDGKKMITESMTLAKIYALAKGDDYTFEEGDEGKVGF